MRRTCSVLTVAVATFVVHPSASAGQIADCSQAAFYQGAVYAPPVTLAKPDTPGRAISTTVGPHCRDAGQPDTVRAIKGISPRLALLRPGENRRVLLAPGFNPELRGHPLHARLYPDGGPRAACAKGKVVTWRYPIAGTPTGRRANIGFAGPGGGYLAAVVYEDTRLTSTLTVGGQPFVADQFHAVAVVRKCSRGRPLVLKLSVRPPPSPFDVP